MCLWLYIITKPLFIYYIWLLVQLFVLFSPALQQPVLKRRDSTETSDYILHYICDFQLNLWLKV